MRTPGGRTPFSGMTATPPPALTSPHNPNPGKRQHQEKPRSEELQFLLLPAEATAHLQTHVQGRARGEGMVAEHPPCMSWDAARSFLESLLLLPYLPPCTGRSIAACRSCPRTPWGQSSGCSRERQGLCSGKEREGHISIERKESAYRTIQSGASHKKGCLPPPYLSDKASHPTALPFVQNSVGYLGDTRSRPPLL